MEFVLSRFNSRFRESDISSVTPDEVLSFLNTVTDGTKQSTKRTRYCCLGAFFNPIKNSVEPKLETSCSIPMLRKLFQRAKLPPWTILDKETVDEVIFRTLKPQNRLMLEPMARGANAFVILWNYSGRFFMHCHIPLISLERLGGMGTAFNCGLTI